MAKGTFATGTLLLCFSFSRNPAVDNGSGGMHGWAAAGGGKHCTGRIQKATSAVPLASTSRTEADHNKNCSGRPPPARPVSSDVNCDEGCIQCRTRSLTSPASATRGWVLPPLTGQSTPPSQAALREGPTSLPRRMERWPKSDALAIASFRRIVWKQPPVKRGLGLGLHSHAPRLLSHRQYYRTGAARAGAQAGQPSLCKVRRWSRSCPRGQE